MKIIKQLFCKHERVVHDSTYLVRQKDGSFITINGSAKGVGK